MVGSMDVVRTIHRRRPVVNASRVIAAMMPIIITMERWIFRIFFMIDLHRT